MSTVRADVDELAHQLETDGFCRLPGVYSADDVATTLELCRKWHARTVDRLAENRPRLAKDDPSCGTPRTRTRGFSR